MLRCLSCSNIVSCEIGQYFHCARILQHVCQKRNEQRFNFIRVSLVFCSHRFGINWVQRIKSGFLEQMGKDKKRTKWATWHIYKCAQRWQPELLKGRLRTRSGWRLRTRPHVYCARMSDTVGTALSWTNATVLRDAVLLTRHQLTGNTAAHGTVHSSYELMKDNGKNALNQIPKPVSSDGRMNTTLTEAHLKNFFAPNIHLQLRGPGWKDTTASWSHWPPLMCAGEERRSCTGSCCCCWARGCSGCLFCSDCALSPSVSLCGLSECRPLRFDGLLSDSSTYWPEEKNPSKF